MEAYCGVPWPGLVVDGSFSTCAQTLLYDVCHAGFILWAPFRWRAVRKMPRVRGTHKRLLAMQGGQWLEFLKLMGALSLSALPAYSLLSAERSSAPTWAGRDESGPPVDYSIRAVAWLLCFVVLLKQQRRDVPESLAMRLWWLLLMLPGSFLFSTYTKRHRLSGGEWIPLQFYVVYGINGFFALSGMVGNYLRRPEAEAVAEEEEEEEPDPFAGDSEDEDGTDGDAVRFVQVPAGMQLWSDADFQDATEFTHLRYTAVQTNKPDEFGRRYRLRKDNDPQRLVICVTLFQESAEDFYKTLLGVCANIETICGKEGESMWKTITVVVIADGREATNQDALRMAEFLGLYDAELCREAVHHMFEFTAQLKADENFEVRYPPMRTIFLVKEKNAGHLDSLNWFFGAFAKMLTPSHVLLLHAGTTPLPAAIYQLYYTLEVNPSIAGACGEVGVANRDFLSPLVSAQVFNSKASCVFNLSLESAVGLITRMPDGFTMYRYEALLDGPLEAYFVSLTRDFRALTPFEAMLYLDMDRVLSLELIAKHGCAYTLHYARGAVATRTVPTEIHRFVKEQRNMVGGYFFGTAYMLLNWRRVLSDTAHSTARKAVFTLYMAALAVRLVLSWFLVALLYVAFFSMINALFQPCVSYLGDPYHCEEIGFNGTYCVAPCYPDSCAIAPYYCGAGPDAVWVDNTTVDLSATLYDANQSMCIPATNWYGCGNGTVYETDPVTGELFNASLSYECEPTGCGTGIDPNKVIVMGFASFYVAMTFVQLILGLGNEPDEVKELYSLSSTFYGLLMSLAYFLFALNILFGWREDSLGIDDNAKVAVICCAAMYVFVLLLHGEAQHVLVVGLQYLFMYPTIVNILTCYSFCVVDRIARSAALTSSAGEDTTSFYQRAQQLRSQVLLGWVVSNALCAYLLFNIEDSISFNFELLIFAATAFMVLRFVGSLAYLLWAAVVTGRTGGAQQRLRDEKMTLEKRAARQAQTRRRALNERRERLDVQARIKHFLRDVLADPTCQSPELEAVVATALEAVRVLEEAVREHKRLMLSSSSSAALDSAPGSEGGGGDGDERPASFRWSAAGMEPVQSEKVVFDMAASRAKALVDETQLLAIFVSKVNRNAELLRGLVDPEDPQVPAKLAAAIGEAQERIGVARGFSWRRLGDAELFDGVVTDAVTAVEAAAHLETERRRGLIDQQALRVARYRTGIRHDRAAMAVILEAENELKIVTEHLAEPFDVFYAALATLQSMTERAAQAARRAERSRANEEAHRWASLNAMLATLSEVASRNAFADDVDLRGAVNEAQQALWRVQSAIAEPAEAYLNAKEAAETALDKCLKFVKSLDRRES